MSHIARLRAAQIANGLVINATDLGVELDQLVNTANNHDDRLGTFETGNPTFPGNVTFSGTTNTFATIPILPASDPTTANLAARKQYVDTVMAKYMACGAPTYASTTTFTVSFFNVANSANTGMITKLTSTTVSTAFTGLNALDTGTVGTSRWFYLYAITDGVTPGLILSLVNEVVTGSITMPSGYTLKRQLPIAIRIDSSGNIIPFLVADGWPNRPLIVNLAIPGTTNAGLGDDAGSVAGRAEFFLLNGGSATTPTTIDCSGIIPAISTIGQFKMVAATAAGITTVGVLGSGTTDYHSIVAQTAASVNSNTVTMPTTSSQTIYYKIVGTRMSVWGVGYIANLVT